MMRLLRVIACVSTCWSIGCSGPEPSNLSGGCGDGRVDEGEECDDRNSRYGDGCRPDCRDERCGDGAPDPGDLCFSAPATYDHSGSRLNVADVNGDGDLDIVGEGQFLVRLGSGDGSLAMAESIEPHAYDVALGRLWSDGVGAVIADGTVLRGSAMAPYLGEEVDLDLGMNSGVVAVADFDDDGLDDIVLASGGTPGRIAIVRSIGDGTFMLASQMDAGVAHGVTVTDVTGDGAPDIVMADDAGDLHVFLVDGTLALSSPITSSADAIQINSVSVGDVNGDTFPDAILTDSGSSLLKLLLGDGDGRFEPAAGPDVGAYAYQAELVDLDGDGALDIVTSNGELTCLLGHGDGTFGVQSAISQSGALAFTTADLDGDGLVDIAATTVETQPPGLQILLADP